MAVAVDTEEIQKPNNQSEYLDASQNQGYLLAGPHKKDYNVVGSILGYPYSAKLPLVVVRQECCEDAKLLQRWAPSTFQVQLKPHKVHVAI